MADAQEAPPNVASSLPLFTYHDSKANTLNVGGEFVTDVVSNPDTAATKVVDEPAMTEAMPPDDGDRPIEWAPAEPSPKKRRGLWIGLGVGAVVLGGAAFASTILIAPGTTVAGIPVGLMTPGMAAETISARLADTEVTLTGAGGDATVTGADLGASLDSSALAEQAFAERPAWNLGAWMGEPIAADLTLDPEAADHALRAAVPASFEDPTEATVTFDAKSGTYLTTPAEPGTGIDLAALTTAFTEATAKGETSLSFSGDAVEAPASISTEEATAAAEKLNGMISSVGFYVGKERTVPVKPEVAASWLTVEDVDGELKISADEAAIQTVVDGLPKAVNRDVVNATSITDSGGNVLKAITEGKDGRTLGDTSDVASDFATQLEGGDAVYALTVDSVPFETTALYRRIEVDLSEQRTYLYENEKLVKSWSISSGLDGSPTDQGRFRVYAQLYSQNMGREDTTVAPFYYQPNVPYVSYYNADEAFHGAYWHNDFGNQRSHGCVNMPVDAAKFVYDWATKGTEVWVHS